MRAAQVLMTILALALVPGLANAHRARAQARSTGGPPAFPVTYPAGWNIVAATQPRPPFFGTAYTLQAGDSDYEVVTLTALLRPKVGYWIYFSHDSNIFVIPVSSCEILIPVPGSTSSRCGLADPNIPVPAGQWVMIGNPLSQPITVSGADLVYTYDPIAGSYVQTTMLQVGRGAFVYSSSGGAVTISPPSP